MSTKQPGDMPRPETLIDLLLLREEDETRGYTYRDDSGAVAGVMSYAELGRRARAIAAELRRGSAPGERALLLFEPGLEYIAGFFGCLLAGIVAVPAYPPDPSRLERTLPRLRGILRDARATVALTSSALLSMATHLFPQEPELEGLRWMSTEEIPPGSERAWSRPDVTASSIAFLQYTSGSTGDPRGVMLGHDNLLHNLALIAHGFASTADSVGVIWLPPYHDMGLIGGILQPLFAGMPVTLMSPLTFLRRPLRWLEAISRDRATISGGPNFAFDLCVRKTTAEERRSLDLRTWELAFTGAEPVRAETIDRFVEAFGPCGFRREAFYPCYGLAEGTLIVSGGSVGRGPRTCAVDAPALERGEAVVAGADGSGTRALVGCGGALVDQRVLVVDPQSLRERTPGSVGEVWVEGRSVARGYWQRPDETAETFHATLADGAPGRFLRTGDLGFFHEGQLFITGRRKDLVILRGRNHYPQDIELTVERSHAALRPGCGAAFAIDEEGEERLVIAQEIDLRGLRDLRQRISVCEDAIAAIRRRVAEAHEIGVWAVALMEPGSIFKTSSGKIQRRACRAAFLAGDLSAVLTWRESDLPARADAPVADVPDPPALSEMERWLVTRLAPGAGRVDPAMPVTHFGLDSLRAVELAHDVERETGVSLGPDALLRGPSVAALAREIDARRGAPIIAPKIPAAPVGGPMPLSSAQQRMWFLTQMEPESAQYNLATALRLEGDVDERALQEALASLARRHDALRTTFIDVDGTPAQVVSAHGALPLEVIDLQGLPAATIEAEAQRRGDEAARRPFDLARGPLARATLLRLGPRRRILVLMVHHIVADGWSLGIIGAELSALYSDLAQGRAPSLPELSMRYADYVRWQSERLQGAEEARQLEYWRARLAGANDSLDLPIDFPRPAAPSSRGARLPWRLPRSTSDAIGALSRSEGATPFMVILAALQVLLWRCSGQPDISVGTPVAGRVRPELEEVVGLFVNTLVLRVDFSSGPTFRELLGQVRGHSLDASAHQDLPFERLVQELRPSRGAGRSPLFQVLFTLLPSRSSAAPSLAGVETSFAEVHTGTSIVDLGLTLWSGPQGYEGYFEYSTDVFAPETIARMAARLETLLQGAIAEPTRPVAALPILPGEEEALVLRAWNATGMPHAPGCIHHLVEAQVARTPDAVAAVFEDETITYRALDARAGAVAARLRALGVGPEVVVGICAERSLDLLAAMLGVLKAGGAYLPLDPTYPRERLVFMLGDAGAPVLLTQGHLAPTFADVSARLLLLEEIGDEPVPSPDTGVTPENLAYVIYTSGSSGRPKGVMVPHRCVTNFFAAMDQRIGGVDAGATWLAVTSVSFDISVLELFWTLTRGVRIVLQGADAAPRRRGRRPGSRSAASSAPLRALDFSLFYFANDADQEKSDRYRLLWEGARFADRHGFAAVWTPERHFHAFGGLYPNPSVVSAAIAAVTERVKIRAGSVVLPLHHPVRVAEEWALVDNLSRGRVGVSFASGWHADDFVFAPERYADRRATLLRDIDVVRRLWRGEKVSFPGGAGTPVEVRLRPEPVQRELPFWLTAAGNPETFETAGRVGANLLTHLLGQSVDELAERIAVYREARRRAGHEGEGQVTLMLHTFVYGDAGTVRSLVGGPFRRYLRSSADLMRGLGRSLGVSLDPGSLREEELDQMVEHAFQRYYETSGLFGTPHGCRDKIAMLHEVGVDEIGCLIDFGVDTEAVLASLPFLDELRQRSERDRRRGERHFSLPEQIRAHGVTHLQCTPSFARALLLEQDGAPAMSTLRMLLLGGEPLQSDLARHCLAVLAGGLVNMYGPTETTVWSSTQQVREAAVGWVPIGTPIGNTTFYILDERRVPVPIGVKGELYIGGEGVARGYLAREELMAERFVSDPFSVEPGARLYRTGDLARFRTDGTVEFLGRADQQVKLRGYRIELGEIEGVLGHHPAVAASVAVVQEDAQGDARLVAYVVWRGDLRGDLGALRAFAQSRLPEYMVPSTFVELPELPTTPNGKVDRKALPAPSGERRLAVDYVPPRTEIERRLERIWAEILKVERVGVHDDFFDLGGHSLLATQIMARVRSALEVDVPLGLLFQSKTIAGLAAHLGEDGKCARLMPLERRRHEEPLPLSLAQERMWFLHQLEPESLVHNVAWLVHFLEPIDVPSLESALAELLRRHEVLRTTFDVAGGGPIQIVGEPRAVRLPVSEMKRGSAGERMEAARELARQLARQPFDLRRGPLLRLELLRLGEGEDALVMVVHHILMDGWSLGVLSRELVDLYRAARRGGPTLPDLPIQYGDYAVSQRRWLGEREIAAQLDYWKRALQGIPAVLELPADRPRPATQSYRGGRLPVRIPRALTDALKMLSQHEGATLYMTLLAAFQVLLHRWSGQEDIVVGSPIAGRGRPELAGLIGFFLNTLALRADLSGNSTFVEHLRRVRQTVLDAFDHQDVPFDKLVEELKPARTRSHEPVFQVMLILQEPARADEATRALAFEEIFTGKTMYDLTLILIEEERELRGTLEFSADLFDPPTIARMIAQLGVLLEGVAAHPEQRVGLLPILPPEELRLLDGWNRTESVFPLDQCFPTLFTAQVERTPDAVAASCGERALSYRELDLRSSALAAVLCDAGVGPDTVVALFAQRGLDLLSAVLGVMKAGGAYLPLDPLHPPQRVAQVLHQSGASRVLVDRSLAPALERAAAELPEGERPRVFVLEEALSAPLPVEVPRPAITPSNLAYVIFTSGSTGLPKGAMLEHRGMVNHLFAKVRDLELTASDVVAQTASQCFDISVWQLLVALLVGGRVHIVEEDLVRDPAALLAALERESVTIAETVPSMLRAMLSEASRPTLAGLRWMIATGEALPPDLCGAWLSAYPDVRLLNAYGPTECSDDVTHYHVTRAVTGPNTPIGRAIANTLLYVLDRNGRRAPVGVPGELYVGGVGVGRGYLGDEQRTAEAFVRDPFSPVPGARMYKTGDLVRFLPGGNIEFLGRLDHQVKVRGFRIELGEIEAILKQHPAVAEAVSVAREIGPAGKQLVAYVVSMDGAPLDMTDLRRWSRERLPDYMVPPYLMQLDALPLSANGKVDRKALPAPDASYATDRFAPPRDDLERALAAIWAEVLGVERVGVLDNFFELGGHSLLAVRLVARVHERLGRRITLASLFQDGTIDHAARTLREATPTSWSPLVRLNAGGARTPLFFIHPVGGTVGCYRELARSLGPDQPFHALQAPGLEVGQEPLDDVKALASYYVEIIRAVQPSGPYLLGGWSMGGAVAFEMASQLREHGQTIGLLALLDTDAQVFGHAPLQTDDLDKFADDLFQHDLARLGDGGTTSTESPAARRLFTGHLRALWRYQPRYYSGDITLFLAEDSPVSAPDHAHGWRSLAAGIDVVRVPGDHYTLLRPPNLQRLAACLRARLERAPAGVVESTVSAP